MATTWSDVNARIPPPDPWWARLRSAIARLKRLIRRLTRVQRNPEPAGAARRRLTPSQADDLAMLGRIVSLALVFLFAAGVLGLALRLFLFAAAFRVTW